MRIFEWFFGKTAATAAQDEAQAQKAYTELREAMTRETPDQKRRFYLEVAALLGNESAAKRLAEMGPDPERARPN